MSRSAGFSSRSANASVVLSGLLLLALIGGGKGLAGFAEWSEIANDPGTATGTVVGCDRPGMKGQVVRYAFQYQTPEIPRFGGWKSLYRADSHRKRGESDVQPTQSKYIDAGSRIRKVECFSMLGAGLLVRRHRSPLRIRLPQVVQIRPEPTNKRSKVKPMSSEDNRLP